MSRLLSAFLALGLSAVCFAQRTTELSGRVTDASQAVITNAMVTVTNVDTRVERTTLSNDLGYYSFLRATTRSVCGTRVFGRLPNLESHWWWTRRRGWTS
jgi:hypothetical protein